MADPSHRTPARLVIVAGTYDGVLAGWDTVEHAREADQDDIELKLLRRNDGRFLKLSFAMAAHEGSVRCLDAAGAAATVATGGGGKGKKRARSDSVDSSPAAPEPGMMLSGGYDETLNVFSLQKHAQIGELKTPSDLGSPLCCSFAPPANSSLAQSSPTHALVGLTSGKVILYKKKDWSVQHVLSGHDAGGVQCLAVHPTGRMALTGGRDGKIVLWDLTKGRLAYVHKLPKLGTNAGGSRGRKETVNHIVWSGDGSRYAFCHGTKITAKDVNTGEDLLDIHVPSRANQLAFIGGAEGMFLAAACDDGSLPVLEVGQLEETDDPNERRAILAIEPAEGVVAGDDRFKCIRSVEGGSGFLVVTANSGGVVSLMDLEGAARMMLGGGEEGEEGGAEGGDDGSGSESDSESDSDAEVEAAVEILDSVRIGSGARITDLSVWSHGGEGEEMPLTDDEEDDESEGEQLAVDASDEGSEQEQEEEEAGKKKRGGRGRNNDDVSDKLELDAEAVAKARKLVGQAKAHQKKKKRKAAKKT
ncbi:hypothetical protein ACHAXT_009074 [Thalassiosira profunda]